MENFRLEGVQLNDSASHNAMKNNISNIDSTSKFTIPTLKPRTSISGLKLLGDSPEELGGNSSNINQFLLKQLEQANNGQHTTERFNVPKLEKGSTTSFVIPELKKGKPCKAPSMTAITTNLHQDIQELKTKLNVEHENATQLSEDHIIDLTTALSSTKIDCNNSVISAIQRKKLQSEIFEIPFIDCDRQQQLPQTDNYCLIDISDIRYHHDLAQPSTLGRILSSNTKRIRLSEIPMQKNLFKAKHSVNRFPFDTNSPDDIVLASLNRFTRTQ